ncbi:MULTISPECIES: tripartite tricarboxylate transporter substrate binding protein [Comamonadaceae]|uniref:tripartite tricarboxylate transporter substrate binding protein n=1 Tax=Comamonadaceae TaxID=80864 RepID=UPI00056FB9BC|nr:tripartite tricarboxylate transporter substrate binding protein [Xenophilus azovorans]
MNTEMLGRAFKTLATAILGSCIAFSSHANGYPNKPVTLVVPFTPGGSNDALARAVGQKLGEYWKQPVIVDNRPGAGGNVGTKQAARAAADGYTLLVVANNFVTNPFLYPDGRAGYDPVKEFVPITQLGRVPFVLVVHPGVAAKSTQELIALAKSQPGKLSYGSAGVGTPHHLTGELFKSVAGIDMVHVPYRGAQPVVTDLIGGQIQVLFGVANSVLPHIKTGALRALAVAGEQPLSYLPNVPTVASAGFNGFRSEVWIGLVAPAGTPADVVAKIEESVGRALRDPNVKAALEAQGLEPAPSNPAALKALMQEDMVRWSKVIKDTGARAE